MDGGLSCAADSIPLIHAVKSEMDDEKSKGCSFDLALLLHDRRLRCFLPFKQGDVA
jgi:hypothetical protein